MSTERQDGRILPAKHWASLVVFVILVPAVVVLWGLPGDTADDWSWTIKPDLTPIFLGAGYGAGAYFFLRTFLAKQWPLIHWDRFNHGGAPALAAIAFYGWVIVYIVSPFAVIALWVANRRTDSGEPAPGEPLVPDGVRLAARLFGVGAMGAAVVFFVFPDTAIDLWPWRLTPLTSRVLGSFTAQVGAGALLLSGDPRWGSWRLLVQTFVVAVALLLVGAARAWDDFDTANVLTYAYVGGLAAQALALALLYRRMSAG